MTFSHFLSVSIGIYMAALSDPTPLVAVNGSEQRERSKFGICIDASQGITSLTIDCIGDQFDRVERQMNRVIVQIRQQGKRGKLEQAWRLRHQWKLDGYDECFAPLKQFGGPPGTLDVLTARLCALERDEGHLTKLRKLRDSRPR